MTELLRVENLTVRYGRAEPAVDDVSLSVGRGETVGLVGESGSGKSTIGRAVLGLVDVAGGRIVFDGHDLAGTPAKARGLIARRLQTVFQDPNGSLNPARRVGRSIVEPREAHGAASRVQLRELAQELLRRVGLPADADRRYPHEFSGGQRQRIAIARALAATPDLIVCDEPTSALDLSTQAQMLNLLAELRRERSLAYLFVSHDLAVIRHVADRIVVLYRGRVMETGPADQVSTAPLHPYTRALQAAAPVADVAAQRARRQARLQLMTTTAPAAAATTGCPFAARCVHAAPVCTAIRPRELDVGPTRVACHLYDPESGHTAKGIA